MHSLCLPRYLAITLLIVCLAFLPKPVQAQVTSTWSASSGAGSWSDCPPDGNALWNTCPNPPQGGQGYPNGNYNAVINGGPVTATSASIVNLSIGSGGSLAFPATNPSILDITGSSIVNNGSIILAGTDGMGIIAPASVTLSGSGSVTMAGNNFTGSSGGGAGLIVQQPVHGYGTFASYTVLTNQSTINAVGGTLFMQPTSVVNTGTFEASNGAILECCPGTPISFTNTGGTIEALNGGTVELFGNTTLTGGTLTTTGTGVIQTSGTVLNALTNNGTIVASSTATLQGTVTNSGTIQASDDAFLYVSGNATLTGSGSVMISGGSTLEQVTDSGNSLINQSLIEGSGTIFQLPLTNQGTINANSNGNTLYVDDGATTNTSVMESSAGGTLELETVVNNSGGTIEAQTGSVVILGGNSNGSLSGGTLTTSGTGVIESENVVLDGTVNIPTNAGNFIVDGGNDLYIQGTVNNTGTITVTGSSCIELSEPATLTGTGTLILNSNACIHSSGFLFTNKSTIEGYGNVGDSNPGPVNNKGTLIANQSNPLVIQPDSTGFTNTGSLIADAGSTLEVNGALTNLKQSTLTGGKYSAIGVIEIQGSITTNSASITLNGASAEIYDTLHSQNALLGLSTNSSKGTLTLEGGQQLTTTANLTNSGKLKVAGGSALTTGGSFTQSGGTLTVDGTLTAPSGITLSKATTQGKGTLAASVASSATLVVGDSTSTPGVLTIGGSYVQNSTGILDIALKGSEVGTQYSQLAVANGASLNGTLNIKLAKGFVPAAGDTFTILTASAVGGTFSTANGTAINSSEHFEVSYNSGSVTLTVASGS